MDTTGHTTKRTTRMKSTARRGRRFSARPAARMAVYSDTPATTTGNGTNSEPTLLSEGRQPGREDAPSAVSAKKARRRPGVKAHDGAQ